MIVVCSVLPSPKYILFSTKPPTIDYIGHNFDYDYNPDHDYNIGLHNLLNQNQDLGHSLVFDLKFLIDVHLNLELDLNIEF